MPTYEYRCAKGHDFELFQRISDDPATECPECGAEAERLLSAGGGLLFKGEGFYTTDYRSDSYRKAANKEGKKASPGESTGASSDSGSTDSGSSTGGTGESAGASKATGTGSD